MAQSIPVSPSESDQQITTTLDGITYVLRVRWNTRDAAWYLDARERDGTAIAFGVKLVVGILLGQAVSHPLFMGGMFVWDLSGEDRDPGFNDLGSRVLLVSLTASDQVLLGLPVPPP